MNAHSAQIPDLGKLRGEIAQLRKDLASQSKTESIQGVDAAMAIRAPVHPNTPQTRCGFLNISGFVQVWYQSVQNDNKGIVGTPPAGDFSDSNSANDNDTFRIRRAELILNVRVNDLISMEISIDPARESASSFYPLPTLAVRNRISGSEGRLGSTFNTYTDLQAAPRQPSGVVPHLLEDAFIHFEHVVPHHDFKIGQILPPAGEEAWRANGDLDFVERSMLSYQQYIRDIGVMIHGSWLDNRLQYWAGVFNGPDGSVLNDTDLVEGGNRSDDNDEKNFAWRLAGRPVWNEARWYGRLELGGARMDGLTGKSGQGFDATAFTASENITRTAVNKTSAWAWYRPGGAARGWWMRGEWGSSRGRFSAYFGRVNLLGIGADASTVDGAVFVRGQLNPAPTTVSGWNASTGYRFAESAFAAHMSTRGFIAQTLLHSELTARYEEFQNVAMEGLVDSDRSIDQFKTRVLTLGLNYSLWGSKAKVQANYFIVDESSDHNPDRGLREIRNNVFAINFQVAF